MKCLLITDIFGLPPYDNPLVSHLDKHTDLTVIHLSALANMPQLVGEELHRFLFEDGGFETAVSVISDLKNQYGVAIGFSAGGSVLWRACTEGLRPKSLFCLSSTRLRFETSKIIPDTHAFYGELDTMRPDDCWLESFTESYLIGPDEGHGFYNKQQSILLKRSLDLMSDHIIHAS